MRRFLILVLCCFLLTTAVFAAGTVTGLQSNASVAADGTCQISLMLQLTLDSPEENLRFPLPREARDITLNGNGAKTSHANGLRWVDISGAVYGPGTYTLNLHYTLPDMVVAEKDGLVLTLPLLSGFSYPIERMEFSIALPGEPEKNPTFFSTYHPESIHPLMEFTIENSVISGHFTEKLKDHETLTMRLPVSDDLFPQPIVKRWSLSTDDLAQYALIILSALYWLIFLRCGFTRRVRWVEVPNGMTAGELGCCLIGQGVDFSTMVLSWAQMGYLSIELGRNRRVLLHKRMDMGNERSDFEVRFFKTLFGKRQKVDGSSEHYARLGRKAAKTIPGAWQYFRKTSGNPTIFRCLAAGIGVFAGISLGAAFAADTAWRVILSLLLSVLGAVISWLIQAGGRSLLLRHKYDLWIALAASLVWFLLGSWAGEWNVALLMILTQFLAGVASANSGRRTEAGLQTRDNILGLRRYLKSVPPEDLRRILQQNPDYYFSMAPYAIALGVDKAFARQFGAEKLAACPYLTADSYGGMTARQWNEALRQAVEILDDRQRKLALQKIIGR